MPALSRALFQTFSTAIRGRWGVLVASDLLNWMRRRVGVEREDARC